MYSPGENASRWEEFYDAGIIAIGWGEIGDLSTFSSKEDMKNAMKREINPDRSHKVGALATWQFANVMKPGDVIIVKKGMHQLVGKGIVTSEYYYDKEDIVSIWNYIVDAKKNMNDENDTLNISCNCS